MSCEDTIAAIATAPGRGGIAIIRVSGSKALDVAKNVCHIIPEARKAYFRKFYDGQSIVDEGVLLYFPGPNSYTGEDTVELQGHGGNVAPQRVLSSVLKIAGVRQAEPGEFTRRAFLNGKMDLTAAEAVEDLSSAGSESAAKAALSSLEGEFAAKLNTLTDKLTTFRMRLEGCLDFPEEHEDFFDSGKAADDLHDLIAIADESLTTAKQGVKLNEGARIVLAGSPNAGKSSLLNALAGEERAIVTNIPGTTRDILSINIEIGGNFFANHGLVILDCAPVKFGDNVFIAPNCGFYTAGHPIDKEDRRKFLEYAMPINVGDDVWVGGNVCVMPGVNIGNNVIIGAGSVVTKDIPDDTVAYGNPCRPIRKITLEDKFKYKR